jgi:hypothetical protein
MSIRLGKRKFARFLFCIDKDQFLAAAYVCLYVYTMFKAKWIRLRMVRPVSSSQ